jgi:hypothetical protein
MSEQQAEALDMVHFAAVDNSLEIKLQTGDIEIFNNLALFHARKGFVDDSSGHRHMIRLWLKCKNRAWKGPEVIEQSGWEIYSKDSPFRSKPLWDIFVSPPLTRGTFQRMSCN